jgi:hypothetical protein
LDPLDSANPERAGAGFTTTAARLIASMVETNFLLGGTLIEIQHSAQALPTLNRTRAIGWCRIRNHQSVAQPLMVPLFQIQLSNATPY